MIDRNRNDKFLIRMASVGLSKFYLSNNTKKTKALELILKYVELSNRHFHGLEYALIIEIWNNIFENLESKFEHAPVD